MKKLEGTDLAVSALCFGTCPVALTLEENELFRLLDRFAAEGGNFLDTANVYGKWAPWHTNLCEQRVGRWLRTHKNAVVATKGCHYDLDDPAHPSRVNEQALRQDLEESLRTLGVETIDLYWLHRDDPAKPIGEILEMCEAQRRAGKLRWYGASNFTAARLEQARQYAAAHGLSGFAAVSNQWSLAETTPQRNNNPDPTVVLMGPAEAAFHTRTGTPCIPYQATARGWFAKTAAGQPVAPEVARAFDTPANRAVLARLQRQAAETGHSVQALALAGLAKQPFPVFPVTAAGSDAQLETLLEALHLLEEI